MRKSAKIDEDIIKCALHPPRITRAAIDNHIDSPTYENWMIVKCSIKIGLDVYRNVQGLEQKVKSFASYLRAEHPDLTKKMVKQQLNVTTWAAMMSMYSSRTAAAILKDTTKEDILLIALGHGGTAAGMDVFLRYCDIAGSRDSKFYVVRFSRVKHYDEEPKISEREKYLLRRLSRKRQIVLFDEDISSGTTLIRAKEYFTTHVFGHDRIKDYHNYTSGKILEL